MRYRIFSNKLIKWGKEHIKDFVWRENGKNPFEILIAEIFLKRTTSSHVVRIYKDFTYNYKSFKDIIDEKEEVLINKLKILGLQNQRAYQLKKMCKYIIERFNGKLPQREDRLIEIPGVGQYIARAILCFGYNIRSYPIDSNVQRVIGRIFINKDWKEIRISEIEEIFKLVQPFRNFKFFNYSILDFGSSICRSSHPKCAICPFTKICIYFNI